ncbi:MAG: hypothetical protein ABR499_01555 [Gemmatimonadaceae bacterium]
MEPSQVNPLGPDLRQAAEALEQALTEACAGKSAHEADTGELIRIEEMLAVASDAAKRAILMRRQARQRLTGGPTEVAREVTADQAATLLTHRLFDDAKGVRWDVWAVYPETRPSQVSALPGTFQSGWLVFESATEKRRLSPIPSDWQTLPALELERLCDQAETAPRRARTPRGKDVPPPPE